MSYVGRRLRRREDERLLRGQGRFVADVHPFGLLHAAFLRSPHAHARIAHLDARAARRARGVVDVVTAGDFAGLARPIPIRMAAMESMLPFRQLPLATTKTRFVGEPLAAVLADSRSAAEDALELIEVGFEPLPAVVDPVLAAAPDAPLLFEEQGTNVVARSSVAYGDLERALREADVVVRTPLAIQRHSAVPIETRGLVAEFDPARSVLTLWGATKVPFFNRAAIARFLGLPEHGVHVVQIDVGGAFGVRGELYPEDFVVPLLAMRSRRPVQWIEDRAEHLLAANHSREQRHEAAIALTRDGTILGMQTHCVADMGAYVRTHGAVVPNNTAAYLPGPYRVPSYRADVTCVVTNKTPAGTYRGPGRFEANFVRERLVDLAAQALALDPAELRRRNFISADAMPYEVGTVAHEHAVVYDAGDYGGLFERALRRFDYAGLRAQQARAQAGGRRVGIGIGFLVEKSGLGPWESARVAVDGSGAVGVVSGVPSVGQGVETIFAQICADVLQVAPDQVTVRHGDTDLLPYGMGTFASRGTVLGGNAVRQAAERVRDKVLELAARQLEVGLVDLELVDGSVRVKGVPERWLTLRDVAQLAAPGSALKAGVEPGLEALAFYEQEEMTYGYGVHLAQVEVDPETGRVTVQRYLVEYEVGRAINPMLVEGQVRGGVAQGLGGALLEELAYDEHGQPRAATLADYALPRAVDVPPVEVWLAEDYPARSNPLGAKGVGEGGAVAVGATIANAVADALGERGARVISLPLTPAAVRGLLG